MTAPAPKITDEQAELMTALLEGEAPDCYVVIPIQALVGQVMVAMNETKDRHAKNSEPGRTSARLIRNLGELGWTKNTIHTAAAAPHSPRCPAHRHPHGLSCSEQCPSCRSVPQ